MTIDAHAVRRAVWFLALLMALAVPLLSACNGDLLEFAILTGGRLEVSAGSVRDGTVVLLDGELVVREEARVRGTVVVLGGHARLDGTIDGDVVAVAGAVELGAKAHLRGDLAAAGALERHPGARIDGTFTSGREVPDAIAGFVRAGPTGWASVLARAASLALVALLAARVAPRAVDRLGEAVRRHPLTAGALGALALLVGIVLVVVMAFTVVLIPVSVIGLLVGVLALLLGWSALGIALGSSLVRRSCAADPGPSESRPVVARRSGRRPSGRLPIGRSPSVRQRLAMAAGVFVVVMLLGALERLPVLGAPLALLATAVGLGAVLLTGFGTRRFVPDAAWPDVADAHAAETHVAETHVADAHAAESHARPQANDGSKPG